MRLHASFQCSITSGKNARQESDLEIATLRAKVRRLEAESEKQNQDNAGREPRLELFLLLHHVLRLSSLEARV